MTPTATAASGKSETVPTRIQVSVDVGSADTALLTAEQRGDWLVLRYGRRGGRPEFRSVPPPQFVIYRDGQPIASGSFEYG